MKLPFISKKREEKDFFLSLLLSPGKVNSILFEKTGENLLILGTSEAEFQGALEALPDEKLIELSDIVISNVEERLPEGATLDKTIFAVPYNWVQEGKIVKENLAKLKAICDALKLTPVGFIISIEAIIAYLHKKEGAPVSAIIVEAGKKHVTCAIVKNGNILSTYESDIEEDIPKTVDKILHSQDVVEVLPSKIILLNFEHAKKTQQALLAHSWSKSLSFLHIPQVEVLESEIESQAVISGVAQQMGFVNLPDVNLSEINNKSTPTPVAIEEEKPISQEAVEEKDVQEETSQETREDMISGELAPNPEAFGFFEEVDILKENIEKKAPVKEMLQEPHETVEEAVSMEIAEPRKSHIPHVALPTMSFKAPHIPKLFSKGSPLLYPIIAVVVLIVLVVSYYYVFEKVEVTVTLDKREVKEELEVVFLTEEETSASDSIVRVSEKEVQVEGSEEKAATGKKETGEKAKGEVTIYNKTEDKKTFAKGTTLVGPNNLLFTLTDEVSVASTSSFSTTFSNAKGKVEASKFGKEYNIPSGTNFSFEDISTANFFAKNDSSFSGGTKKEIKVVSKDDVNALTTKIVNTLEKKAIEEESSKKTKNEELLPVALSYSFDEKSLSKDEGDEADNVGLTAIITFTLGYLNKNEVNSLAKELSNEGIPDGYEYSSNDSALAIEDVGKNDDGDVTGKIKFSSVFLPKVNPASFSEKLTGKSQGKVSEIIGGDGISNVDVVFARGIPFMPKILPFNKNNIVVNVKSN